MMQKLSFALVLLVICQFANGQRILGGRCKTPTRVPDFDISRYVGLWYQYGRYPEVGELGQKCSTTRYGLTGDVMTIQNSAVSGLTNTPSSTDGKAVIVGPGIFNVKMGSGGIIPQSDNPNYHVAATDYDSYALVLDCTNLLVTHSQSAWCLTREQFPSAETIAKCMAGLDANEVPQRYFQVTDQLHCPAVRA